MDKKLIKVCTLGIPVLVVLGLWNSMAVIYAVMLLLLTEAMKRQYEKEHGRR